MQRRFSLNRRLEKGPAWFLTLFSMSCAFSVYFCMYAFRKPFSAGKYEGVSFLGTDIDLKTALVVSQIIGYTLSKFIGVKICSEVSRQRRASTLIVLVLLSHLALLLFAVLPSNLKVAAIFLNGLPLGMIWGLVVRYLEGRRTSELLLAGLSCSFIIASGIVKDVGRSLMAGNDWLPVFSIDLPGLGICSVHLPNILARFGVISETWMPFATGLLFLLPFLVAVLLLNQVPDPTDADEQARTARKPMDGANRMAFIKQFLPGLVLLFTTYFFLTAYRDFRDNYGVEIFTELGYGETPGIFSRSELWVAFGVLVPMALLFLIKNNRVGLMAALGLMTLGTIGMAIATLLFDSGHISGLTWMILVGLGSYLTYVPFGSVLFDRLIASTHVVGTAVFAIYLADALGYTGSIGVQLFKDLFDADATRLEFFRTLTYFMAGLGTLLLICSSLYFLKRSDRQPAPTSLTSNANAIEDQAISA